MMSVAVSGKQIPRPNASRGSKHHVYRTKSYDSEVDETLFGSPARYSDQKETPRVLAEDVKWDPPWVTSPTKKGVPLLWTPFDPKGADDECSASIGSARRTPKSFTPRTPTSARNKYRLRKLVPSYVDETLFGTPPKEPDFDAPWETDENKPGTNSCQVTWSPPVARSHPSTPIGSARLHLKSSSKRNSDTSSHNVTPHPYTPVIKARPGSAINTPEGRLRQKKVNGVVGTTPVPVSKVQQRLDFGVPEEDHNKIMDDKKDNDPDAIVERALRLAGIYSRKENANRQRSNSLGSLSSRATSPGGYFWKRPPSVASSTGKPGSPGPKRAPPSPCVAKPPGIEVDDLFVATGRQVTLSARSTPCTPRSRPSSARSQNTQGSVPGLDLSKPPKAYGSRRPASARSARSSVPSSRLQSPLSSRPSWRP